MNLSRAFLFLPSALLTLVVAASLTSAEGCGTSQADCTAACPSGVADGTCSIECTMLMTACTTADDLGDFQALLTCVANSGNALSPLPTDCTVQKATVEANCQGTGVGSGSGSSSSASGTGTSTGVGTGTGISSSSSDGVFTCTQSTEGTCPNGYYCCGGAGFGYECVLNGNPCPL
jgi:hypothetical protein